MNYLVVFVPRAPCANSSHAPHGIDTKPSQGVSHDCVLLSGTGSDFK